MSYKTDTSDERLVDVNDKWEGYIKEDDKMFDDMADDSDSYYQKQINASKNWAKEQTKLQNDKTNQTIKEINQQKAQAQKDYTKEQSGAYVDWQKQSNEYGANAEQMAAQGMTNTGFAESSQVSMYNTYQNRFMTARESFERSKLNFDNAITQAKLQNSSILAEIAYEALQKQLELSLAGFQYKNSLLLQKAETKRANRSAQTAEYQAVLDQIYKEDALQEEMDQFDETMAYNKARDEANRELERAKLAEEQRQFNENLAFQKSKASSGSSTVKKSSGSSSGSSKSKKSSSGSSGSSTIKSGSKTSSNGNTANAQKKINSLSMMQGQRGSQTAIANSIVSYAKLGQINKAETEYMLKHFGYNPSKYIK